MKKPKFKFELSIGETIELLKGNKVDSSGALTPDPLYTCTGIIDKPNFKLPKELYGKEVSIALYEIVGSFNIFISTTTYSSFMESQNNFTFIRGQQSARIFVKQENLRLDADNFIIYTYNTHPRFSKLSKDISRESGEMYMRAKLKGNLSYGNGAFDKIASLGINNCMVLNISKYNYDTDTYEPYYCTARFTKLDCQFDYDKRSVTPKTEPDDQYTKILSSMNDEYDLIKLNAQRSRATYTIPPMEQYFIQGGKQVTNIIGETYFNTDAELPEPQEGQTENDVLIDHHFSLMWELREIRIHTLQPTLMDDRYDLSFILNTFISSHPGLDSMYAIGPDNCNYEIRTSVQAGAYYTVLFNTATGTPYAYVQGNLSVIALHAGIEFRSIANPSQVIAIVTGTIDYPVWYRTLYFDKSNQIPALHYQLSDDDFAYNGTVYNRISSGFGTDMFVYASASTSFNSPGEHQLFSGYNGYFTDRDVHLNGARIPIPGQSIPDIELLDLPLPREQGQHIIPICSDTWGDISVWVYGKYPSPVRGLGYEFENTSCFTVFAAIRAILEKVAPSVRLLETLQCSEFFYGFYNIITGTKHLYPLITAISNIEAGAYDQAAQTFKVKLKDLFDLLKNALRCYWYIDDDNVMHIEHISWFLNGGTYGQAVAQLDITQEQDIWNRKIFDLGHGELKYSDTELYKRLELSAEEDTTDACSPVNIDIYDASLANTDVSNMPIGDFKVNMDYIFGTASDRSDGAVFMMALLDEEVTPPSLIFSNMRYIVPADLYSDASMLDDAGSQYSIMPTNTYAMPRFLAKYYMYDFPGKSISNPAYAVIQQKKYRVQQIRIPIVKDLQPYGLINTRFGRGLINSISIDFDTQYTDIELLHDSSEYPWAYEEEGAPVPEVLFDKRIYDVGNVYDEGGDYRMFVYPPSVLQLEIPSSSPYATAHSLADLLFTYPEGVNIEAQFRFLPDMLPSTEDLMYVISSSEYPFPVLPIIARYLAITAQYSIHGNEYTIGAGFVDIDLQTGEVTPTSVYTHRYIGRGDYVAICISLQLVSPNVQCTVKIAQAYGGHSVSGYIPYSSINAPGASIALATANYSSLLRYKDVKIIKR